MGDMVEKETARVKDYMMLINIADSRTMFRIRTKMLELKANMKNMYGEGNIACDTCSTWTVESWTALGMHGTSQYLDVGCTGCNYLWFIFRRVFRINK